MIFPILRGLLSPLQAPVTFLLFALNLMVFIVTYDEVTRTDQGMDELLADSAYLETQGAAFAVMIDREPATFSRVLTALAGKALAGEKDSRKILGSLAIRNVEFMNRAAAFDFGGDELALRMWREKFIKLREIQDEHPSYLWGISRFKDNWMQFVTYQFAHSGWLHLFWNMLFLIIFGSFIETTLGGSFVALTYVGAGLIGAVVFSQVSGISSAPLVGASAAVSGLMSLVGFAWLRKEKLRFFFWLLPFEGYFGIVMLPSWLILIVSLLPDLSGYISASRDFGSVAYSAHLGGAAWGLLMAGSYLTGILRRETEDSEASSEDSEFRKAG